MFKKLAGPAKIAIQTLTIRTVEDLAGYAKIQILALHGVIQNALKITESEMERLKSKFKG